MTEDDHPPHDTHGESFDEVWAWYKPRKVHTDRKISYPQEIQDEICDSDAPKGKSVCWNYEQNSGWIVISERPIDDSDYRFAARSVMEQAESEYTKIRARDELPDKILDRFYKGNYLIYLARYDMLDDNPSTWLLERRELMRILPGNKTESEVKKQLTRNPGFLSTI